MGEGTKSAQKGILHYVLAEHRVPRQIACEIIGPVQVRQDELPESVCLTGVGPGDPRRRTFAGPGACPEQRGEVRLHGLTTSSLASRFDDDGARHVRVQGTEIAELTDLGEGESEAVAGIEDLRLEHAIL